MIGKTSLKFLAMQPSFPLFYLFIHSFNKYFLEVYYVTCVVGGIGGYSSEQNVDLAFMEFIVLWDKMSSPSEKTS